MAFHKKLEKILMIKEREKDEKLAEYNEAVEGFEEVATKLYQFLKQKEELENLHSNQITKGLPIQQIQQTQKFFISLDRSIEQYQKLVANARQAMHGKENQLLEKNIEVKKFEKVKEKKLQMYLDHIKVEEGKLMDEISIQQYMNRGN